MNPIGYDTACTTRIPSLTSWPPTLTSCFPYLSHLLLPPPHPFLRLLVAFPPSTSRSCNLLLPFASPPKTPCFYYEIVLPHTHTSNKRDLLLHNHELLQTVPDFIVSNPHSFAAPLAPQLRYVSAMYFSLEGTAVVEFAARCGAAFFANSNTANTSLLPSTSPQQTSRLQQLTY